MLCSSCLRYRFCDKQSCKLPAIRFEIPLYLTVKHVNTVPLQLVDDDDDNNDDDDVVVVVCIRSHNWSARQRHYRLQSVV